MEVIIVSMGWTHIGGRNNGYNITVRQSASCKIHHWAYNHGCLRPHKRGLVLFILQPQPLVHIALIEPIMFEVVISLRSEKLSVTHHQIDFKSHAFLAFKALG